MEDKDKTKEQLISGLAELRRRIAELERLETERKLAGVWFASSEEFLSSAMEQSPVSLWISDSEGTMMKLNQSCRELFGVTDEESVGKYNLFKDNLLEEQGFLPLIKNVFEKGGVAQFTVDYDLPRVEHVVISGATHRILDVIVSPIKDMHGKVTNAMVQHKDITEIKRMEEALYASEKRFEDVALSSGDWIWEMDASGKYTFAAGRVEQVLGYTPEELIGKTPFELMPEEEAKRVGEIFEKIASSKDAIVDLENRNLSKKGDIVYLSTNGVPLIDSNGDLVGYRGVDRDITELKRWRENMLFYISEITRAQEEERKRIARDLHDETAQALATLSLDIEAITRAREQLSQETLGQLEQLQDKVDAVMQGVRRFSHELRPGVLDQLGLLPALEWLAEDMIINHGVDARVEVIGTERRLSPEEELVLFRIAQEALCNVRKHSQATEAVLILEFCDQKIRMAITDNCQGFELPDMLSDFAGKGKLGILGMHERARLLDGSFSVQSEAGKGTTLSVEVAG